MREKENTITLFVGKLSPVKLPIAHGETIKKLLFFRRLYDVQVWRNNRKMFTPLFPYYEEFELQPGDQVVLIRKAEKHEQSRLRTSKCSEFCLH